MLEKAVALHRKGQLAEAGALYRKILKQNPEHVDALHLLGVIETQRKNLLPAIELFNRAIELDPKNAAIFSNRGTALKELKRLEEALASFNRALAIKPDYAEAFNNRGVVLKDLNRAAEALASFDRAIATRPDYAEALYNRGNVLTDLKRHDEALVSYARALVIRPDHAETLYNRGNALMQLKRPLEALASYDRALAVRPDYDEALCNRGIALKDLKRLDEAVASYDRALAIKPDYAEALYNRGNALTVLRRLDEALESFDRALAMNSNYSECLNSRGNVLTDLRRLDEALGSYDRALALNPAYAEARHNRGLLRLLCGDYRNGFKDYEWRWEAKDFSNVIPKTGIPQWRGEDLAGRSILIFGEQGLGDQIQFARYLPLLIERGAGVTFFCSPKLIRLLQTLDASISFVTSLTGEETFDFQCALMSLPLCLATDAASIPTGIPYLKAEAQIAEVWGGRVGDSGFKIGIAWQGNPNRKVDWSRSLQLAEFIPLARRPSVRLISLQKNNGVDQLANLPADMVVETLGDDFDGGPDAFIDTAAVMSHLDLIITSDTSIAHLAGALGRPTWVALQHVPDWRWLLDRDDCPWYPTMRLFRQKQRGDWSTVFEDIGVALDTLRSGSLQAKGAVAPD